jgi:hypothetical protein
MFQLADITHTALPLASLYLLTRLVFLARASKPSLLSQQHQKQAASCAESRVLRDVLMLLLILSPPTSRFATLTLVSYQNLVKNGRGCYGVAVHE